jgi:hypothetical protein
LKYPRDKIDGLKEEILIMNEAQEREFRDEVSNDDIEVVNEMKVEIINDKENWFMQLAKRIARLLITRNNKEENKDNQRAVIVFF